MPYPKNLWERQNLVRKKPKPITNAFGYNPQKVVKPVKFQTGIPKNISKDSRTKALAPGKRISKNNKVYYEYRPGHSDIGGRIKQVP